MALSITSGIPDTIIAGDAVSFTVNNADFPVSTWATATIYFKNGTNAVRSFSGTVSGSNHLFTLTNAQTATLFAGRNLVSVSYSDGTYRGSTAWTEIDVLADPASASTATAAETILAALDAAILTLSSATRSSVSVDGVSYTNADLGASGGLATARTYWASRVYTERQSYNAARGICGPRNLVTFGS